MRWDCLSRSSCPRPGGHPAGSTSPARSREAVGRRPWRRSARQLQAARSVPPTASPASSHALGDDPAGASGPRRAGGAADAAAGGVRRHRPGHGGPGRGQHHPAKPLLPCSGPPGRGDLRPAHRRTAISGVAAGPAASTCPRSRQGDAVYRDAALLSAGSLGPAVSGRAPGHLRPGAAAGEAGAPSFWTTPWPTSTTPAAPRPCAISKEASRDRQILLFTCHEPGGALFRRRRRSFHPAVDGCRGRGIRYERQSC